MNVIDVSWQCDVMICSVLWCIVVGLGVSWCWLTRPGSDSLASTPIYMYISLSLSLLLPGIALDLPGRAWRTMAEFQLQDILRCCCDLVPAT